MMDPTAVAILYIGLLWGLWKFEEWLRQTRTTDNLLLLVTWSMRIATVFTAFFVTLHIPSLLVLLAGTDTSITFFVGLSKVTWVFILLLGIMTVGIMIYMALQSLKQLGRVVGWGGRKER